MTRRTVAVTVDVEGDWGTASLRGVDEALPVILDGFDLPNNAFLDYNPILTSSHTTTGACQCTPPVVTFSPASLRSAWPLFPPEPRRCACCIFRSRPASSTARSRSPSSSR